MIGPRPDPARCEPGYRGRSPTLGNWWLAVTADSTNWLMLSDPVNNRNDRDYSGVKKPRFRKCKVVEMVAATGTTYLCRHALLYSKGSSTILGERASRRATA